MPLKYNTETSVERDFKTQSDIDTEFLNQENIVGRESDKQTENFSYTESTQGINTLTLTQDIILTSMSASVGGGASRNAYLKINGVTKLTLRASNALTKVVPVPNWLLRTGDILTIDIQDGSSTGDFIGYLA